MKATKCSDVNANMSVEAMAQAIKELPPGPWPDGWAGWDNVRDAHILLLNEFIQEPPPMPTFAHERGIVISVNAKPGHSSGKSLSHGYFPGAWVTVKELRRMGCTLPITFAFMGKQELDYEIADLVRPLGVTCMDLCEENRRDPMRILAGFESKVFAICRAPYKQVLYLDADNVPVKDPTYLFDSTQFRFHGAVLWPDLPPYDRAEWLPKVVWRNLGMDYIDTPACESGQLLINKETCWRELCVARWLNEHSDYLYRFVFGDKDTFVLGWHKVNRSLPNHNLAYCMPRRAAGWNQRAILQHDFTGALLFQHCTQDKPGLGGYGAGGYLVHEGHCREHLAELRGLWPGQLWRMESQTEEARQIQQSLEGQTFLYDRVGLGARPMRLLEDGRVGKGMAKMEVSWAVFCHAGETTMVVSDIDGRPTMALTQQADGTWKGHWFEHERCPVVLSPIEAERKVA